MGNRVLLVAVVLVLAAAAFWLVTSGGGSSDPQSDATGGDAAGERTNRPELLGREPPPKGSDPATEAVGEVVPETTPEDLRHVLRGQVTALASGASASCEVRVSALGEELRGIKGVVQAIVGAEGRFEADVTALFSTPVRVVELVVRIDHPEHMPLEGRAAVESTVATAKRGAHVHEIALTLVRAGRISGRVLGADGGGRANVPVAAFDLDAEGQPRGRVVEVRTQAEGGYVLRVPRAGRYLVVSIAPGLLPASCIVHAVPGTTVTANDLRLDPGVSISGEVRFRGKPCAGAEVGARAVLNGRFVGVGLVSLRWHAGEVRRARVEVRSDDHGQFLIEGLSPGEHRLSIEGVGPLMHQGLRRALVRSVEAPSQGVVIDVLGVELVIQVRGLKPPDGRATVIVSGGGTMATSLGHDSELEMLISAGDTYEIDVRAKGFERFLTRVKVDEPGTRHLEIIELVPRKQRPDFRVELVAPDGAQITRAGFGFFPPDKPDALTPRSVDVNKLSEDGTLHVKEVEPGRRLVVIRPGQTWLGGNASWLEIREEIRFPRSGTVTRRYVAKPGARLRVAALTPEGKVVSARCVLRDAAGKVLPVMFFAREEGSASWGTGRLQGGAPSIVMPALPAGRYRIEVDHPRFKPFKHEFTLEQGKTRTLELKLKRYP